MSIPPLHNLDYLLILDLEAVCDDPTSTTLPEIVELPWLVFDLSTHSALDHKQIFITPHWNANPNPPPDAVRGLGTDVAFASCLEDAILQFDAYIYASFMASGKSFCLLTDGPWDLNDLLFVEAARKAVVLAPHFRTFVDLRKEFSRCYPQAPVPTDRRTMFAYLEISTEPRASGLDECVALSAVVSCMLRDGHVWGLPEVVSDYEWQMRVPAIANAAASAIPVGGIVRLRGLPWSCTEEDIVDFLRGLRVVPGGVHFVRNGLGKSTGEAFVQLESVEAVNGALGRHKEMMGRRYIEVFKSSPGDMCNHLGRVEMRRGGNWGHKGGWGSPGGSTKGGAASASGGKPGTFVVKVIGVPSSTVADDLLPLFDGLEMVGEGIHLVKDAEGACNGEAFVELTGEVWAKKAVARSGAVLNVAGGGFKVDIRRSSGAQLKSAFAGNGGGTAVGKKNGGGGKYYVRIRNVGEGVGTAEVVRLFEEFRVADDDVGFSDGGNGTNVNSGESAGKKSGVAGAGVVLERVAKVGFASREARDAALAANKKTASLRGIRVVLEDGGSDGKPQRGSNKGSASSSNGGATASGGNGDVGGNGAGKVVRMRGLPYSSTDEDIVEFFSGYEIATGGISRGMDRHGRASGEAWVTFVNAEDAKEAVAKLDKAHMGTRYIELKF